MKSTIAIIGDENGVEVEVDEEIESDLEVINLMTSGLIGEAELIAKSHECEDKDCCVKMITQEIADALKSTLKLHNIRHHHGK